LSIRDHNRRAVRKGSLGNYPASGIPRAVTSAINNILLIVMTKFSSRMDCGQKA
jgi:hypothetical protein